MKIVQVDLENIDGNEQLTTWVDNKPGLKTGTIITLADFRTDIKWKIKKIYTGAYHDASEFDWHRKWNNNI